jgi:oxygen-independent coproporphyrinogen-3 oxidase
MGGARTPGAGRLTAADVVGSFDARAGAYLHVPFCDWICPFCPYNKVRAETALATRYFGVLTREVDAYVAAHQARFGPFTSLYVGGGTPTLYPERLAEMVARIPVSGERAVEVLPTHGTPERLDALAAAGFTAVSIGAQSFHDAVLTRLHRPHDAETSRSAVRAAKDRFDCVDVDLIVDVELEDEADLRGVFVADVRTCFEMGVDQVSTYPLMRFGYTPFGVARHDRRREHAVLAEVTSLAAAYGYERRSVWTFNRLGSASYTSITRPRFLGMGAGSSSFSGRDFYVNHFGLGSYAAAIDAGELPVARWLHLGRWGGGAYDAFWQAYAGSVRTDGLSDAYGPAVSTAARAMLAPLAAARRVERSDGEYRLTARGFDTYHDLERWVTYQLIEPLWAQMLTEHVAEGATVRTEPGRPAPAEWVRPAQARRGRLWSLASRMMERPVRGSRRP